MLKDASSPFPHTPRQLRSRRSSGDGALPRYSEVDHLGNRKDAEEHWDQTETVMEVERAEGEARLRCPGIEPNECKQQPDTRQSIKCLQEPQEGGLGTVAHDSI